MAFKYALFAALCIAQSFAFTHVARSDENTIDPAEDLPKEFDGIIEEFGKIGEFVTTETSETGADINVIFLCLEDQKDDYVQLGKNVSDEMRKASREISQILGETAKEYAQILRPPLKNITDTLKKLPQEVLSLIKKGEYINAAKKVMEARENVKANGIFVGEKLKEMLGKVPEVAGLAEEKARNIRKQAKEGMEKIRKAFKKCVEEGGPSQKTSDEE